MQLDDVVKSIPTLAVDAVCISHRAHGSGGHKIAWANDAFCRMFATTPEAALGLDFYLSMSGIAAFPRSDALREIFAAAPLDRILVETDSPYLAPPPMRGKRCEPAFTAHTAARGAETMGISYEDFCAATSANFDRLFWKAAA